jgi:long-chain fatty acid transport protein
MSRRYARTSGALLGAAILAITSASAQASGFQLAEQSAKGLGNAFAGGAAVASDASTIFYNPAGMKRIEGNQLSGTITFIFPSGKWQDRGSADAFGSPLTGTNGGDGGEDAIVPVFYALWTLDDRWSAGIGVTVPFGLATKWHDTWKGRYQAIESSIKTLNIQPTLARRINDEWSVGAGFDYQYIDVKLSNQVDYGTLGVAALGPASADALGLAPQQNDGRAIVDGDDWSAGWNAGVLYEMDEDTRIGLHYRSKIKHDIRGDANFVIPERAKPLQGTGAFVDTDATTRITVPEFVNLSGVHQYDRYWTFMADAQWTRWSRLDDIVIKYKNASQPDTVLDLDWQDTWKLAAGADYRYDDYWTFRFGVAHDQDTTKRSTRTPRLPTSDRYWVSVGFTYQWSENLEVDFGYSHVFVKDGQVNNEGSQGDRVVGRSKNKIDLFSVGGTLRF